VPCIVQFGACGVGVVGDAGGDVLDWSLGGDAGEGCDLGPERVRREGAAEVAVELGDAAAAAVGISEKGKKLHKEKCCLIEWFFLHLLLRFTL